MNESDLKARGWFEITPGLWVRSKSPGPSRLRTIDQKPTQGNALERALPRENKGRARARIRITVFARRPADYDGWHVKELLDGLVRAKILDGDEWDKLQGEHISEKVHSQEEERTEIVIAPL